jgi:DNA-binding CsgD family transcriptional regulator
MQHIPVSPSRLVTMRSCAQVYVLGHTNVEIASLMFLSPRTIETHRANIQCKLRVKSRADLVRFASRRSEER